MISVIQLIFIGYMTDNIQATSLGCFTSYLPTTILTTPYTTPGVKLWLVRKMLRSWNSLCRFLLEASSCPFWGFEFFEGMTKVDGVVQFGCRVIS